MCWFAALGALATGTSTAGASAALAATQAAVGASLTATVGSAAAGIIGQTQQARQQRKFQAAATEAEQTRLQQQLQAMRVKQDQEMQARQSELFAIQQRARASVARATVASGEAGVSGSSVDLLLDDSHSPILTYQYALPRALTHTHLRAHETKATLHLRLLLEKKNLPNPSNEPLNAPGNRT